MNSLRVEAQTKDIHKQKRYSINQIENCEKDIEKE